jgi:hypothetical protein
VVVGFLFGVWLIKGPVIKTAESLAAAISIHSCFIKRIADLVNETFLD